MIPNCTQTIKNNDILSLFKEILSGVPQGSIKDQCVHQRLILPIFF